MNNNRFTFENFQVSPETKKCYDAFLSMVKPDAKPLLLVHGNIGNGKTHLCFALANALKAEQNITVTVQTWADVVRLFKSSFNRPDLSYDKLFNSFRKASHLLIDDVGMGSSGSEWEWGQLEDIIDYRYHSSLMGENLFTVVVTNKTIDELPPRIVSRFCEQSIANIILNNGGDYRKLWLKKH